MVTRPGTQGTNNKNSPLLIAGLIALIVIAVFVGIKLMPHRDIITLQDTPQITFVKQKAVECKGDYSRLSPEDQAKIEQITNNHGAMSISIYYHPAAQKN